ncbi:hypothetical protein [Streptomyces sp. UH6]|uniref:hypothetical protein n=1 Tax=Streptomyces sp. UH6 TaxID=2748379 RepID=UPI0015D50865|nr:hypothetical protein [Streptomyces sp. UH6]NYV72974.1 hypothetical protein [Streptomyces sp. UH6]
MSTEPTVTLFSDGLLSKWGFNDGEPPNGWYDYCEANGIDYNAADFPLVELVRRYLVPVLDQDVNVVEIETSHNPIRVDTVDGVDVTEAWFGRAPAPTLTPEHVDVPMSEVAKLIRR